MIRTALLACTLALSACGEGSGSGKAASAPGRPVPTPAEKAALLAALPAPYNGADLENGRQVFARCRSCHTITEGGPNMTGPNLHGVFGREAGTAAKYTYSTAVREADFVWDAARLDDWLENPRTFLKGTKMSFAGIPDETDRRDVIAFLKVETGYAPPPAP
ncbi:MAG TPA: cytochrome c family protein [Brevundimonas sp.]|nr:cytochrome c family protein [Brevundimonas sp.]